MQVYYILMSHTFITSTVLTRLNKFIMVGVMCYGLKSYQILQSIFHHLQIAFIKNACMVVMVIMMLMSNFLSFFCTEDAFNFLSQNLGLKWETFIRSLPGFAGDEATKVIEMSTMDERYAVNQIHRALSEWFRRYPDVVTKESICKVLLDIELNETLDDMKKYLWKKNMHNNVQQSGALMEPVQESRHNHQ